jgi:hypothetical protein
MMDQSVSKTVDNDAAQTRVTTRTRRNKFTVSPFQRNRDDASSEITSSEVTSF